MSEPTNALDDWDAARHWWWTSPENEGNRNRFKEFRDYNRRYGALTTPPPLPEHLRPLRELADAQALWRAGKGERPAPNPILPPLMETPYSTIGDGSLRKPIKRRGEASDHVRANGATIEQLEAERERQIMDFFAVSRFNEPKDSAARIAAINNLERQIEQKRRDGDRGGNVIDLDTQRRERQGDQPSEPVGSLDVVDAGDDPGVIPPREWLLGNQFCRG